MISHRGTCFAPRGRRISKGDFMADIENDSPTQQRDSIIGDEERVRGGVGGEVDPAEDSDDEFDDTDDLDDEEEEEEESGGGSL